MGRRLAEIFDDPRGIRLIGSPLGRAQRTARMIAGQLGLSESSVEVEHRLSEVHFGEWQGLTNREIQKRFPAQWRERLADKWGYIHEGGEGYAAASHRVREWLGEIQGDGTVIVVGHQGINRLVRGIYLGLRPEAMVGLKQQNETVFVLSQGKCRTLGSAHDRPNQDCPLPEGAAKSREELPRMSVPQSASSMNVRSCRQNPNDSKGNNADSEQVGSDISFHLERLASLRQSGMLVVVRPQATSHLVFDRGRIALAQGGYGGVRLGRILLEARTLTESELVRALSDQQVDRCRTPLARLLVESGRIDIDGVSHALRSQCNRVLATVLSGARAQYHWLAGSWGDFSHLRDKLVSVDLPVEQAIREHSRRSLLHDSNSM